MPFEVHETKERSLLSSTPLGQLLGHMDDLLRTFAATEFGGSPRSFVSINLKGLQYVSEGKHDGKYCLRLDARVRAVGQFEDDVPVTVWLGVSRRAKC